jgi:glycerol-3-phosphate acyltransferase PlsY
MDSPLSITITACSAYLVGSIPTAVLVARAKGIDIYSIGSGNPGASNVARALGKRWAILVFVVDAGKGAVAVAVSRFVLSQSWAVASLMGLAAVVGHSWPVTTKFKGGRGVATGGGALAILHPIVALVAAAIWAVLAKLTKKASLASLAALVVAVGGVVVFGRSWQEKVLVGGIAAVVTLRHLPNIKRLLAGDELSLETASEVSTTPEDEKA